MQKEVPKKRRETREELTLSQYKPLKEHTKGHKKAHPIQKRNKGHRTIHKEHLGSTKRDVQEYFNICIDKTLSLDIMSFLPFQIVQKMHKDLVFQILCWSLWRKEPHQPKRDSLTEEGITQKTSNKENSKSLNTTLIFEQ